MKELPLISVIISVLNGAETLDRCLESIVSQDYPCIEIVVKDGGSTDGSLNIIRKYTDSISHWESGKDRGIYHAWNMALEHAHGRWICFLGADDFFWNPQTLSALLPYLQQAESKGIKVVYGQAARVDIHGNVVSLQGKPWKRIAWLMRHGMVLQHTGLMHHQRLFELHGRFDPSYRIAGDYELLLRELKDRPALFAENIRTVGCRIGGLADSSNLTHHKEVFRARRQNGLFALSWVWTLVFSRAIVRHLWKYFAG